MNKFFMIILLNSLCLFALDNNQINNNQNQIYKDQINDLNQKLTIFETYHKKLSKELEIVEFNLKLCAREYSSKNELQGCIEKANIDKTAVRKDIDKVNTNINIINSELNNLYKKMGTSRYNPIETTNLKKDLLERTEEDYKKTKSELLLQHTRNLECINLAKSYELAKDCERNFKYKLTN